MVSSQRIEPGKVRFLFLIVGQPDAFRSSRFRHQKERLTLARLARVPVRRLDYKEVKIT